MLDWRAGGPEQSPIEDVCLIKPKIQQQRPCMVAQLKTCLAAEWQKIPCQFVFSVLKCLFSHIKRKDSVT